MCKRRTKILLGKNKLNALVMIGVVLTLILSGPQAEALNLVIGENFTGTSSTDSGFIPPDTMGGVGPNHIVELINGRFAVYNKVGNGAVGVPVLFSDLDTFWQNAGLATSGTFDPRVVYDHASGRWLAVAVNNGGAANDFLVAVSASSDPTAGWTGFAIDSDADDSHWADFPTLGVDADGVYISANMFPLNGGGVDITVLSIPKSDLLLGAPTVANHTLFEGAGLGLGFAVQPAVDFGPSDGRGAMLAVDASFFGVLDRTDVLGAALPPPATLGLTAAIPTPLPTSFPPLARQPGVFDNIDAGDDRFSGNVFEVDDSLWAVHSVDVGGRAAIRWYEIDETNNNILQTGTISDSELDLYYPSIAANDWKEVVIGFSGSSDNQFISTYAVLGETMAGVTTFGGLNLLKAGVAEYEELDSIGRNRWGDYSATVVDPTDPFTFWTFQEWANTPAFGFDNWSVQITELRVEKPIPEPGSFALFVIAILGMLGYGWRRRKRLTQ